jgi:hypothetical protein
MSLLAVVATRAGAELPDPALEKNREVVLKVRAHPEQYTRLLQDLKAFLNLPPDKQDKLRRLDFELHDAGQSTARLNPSLERYAEWFEKLPEELQKTIDDATSPAERLRIVKGIREQEWVDRLPKAKRDLVMSASEERRPALIKQLRQEEKKRRQEWQISMRHWDELLRGPPPTRPAELHEVLRTFVENVLVRRLSVADANYLKDCQGKWPDYLRALVELADRYVPFPGREGAKKFDQLSPAVQRYLSQHLKPAQLFNLRMAEGKWPEYPLQVLNLTRRIKLNLPEELGPSKPQEFDEPVQRFIRNQLMRQLTPEERSFLRNAESHWPRYPRALAAVANQHGMQVPGMLPGPKEYWDKYRAKPLGNQDLSAK